MEPVGAQIGLSIRIEGQIPGGIGSDGPAVLQCVIKIITFYDLVCGKNAYVVQQGIAVSEPASPIGTQHKLLYGTPLESHARRETYAVTFVPVTTDSYNGGEDISGLVCVFSVQAKVIKRRFNLRTDDIFVVNIQHLAETQSEMMIIRCQVLIHQVGEYGMLSGIIVPEGKVGTEFLVSVIRDKCHAAVTVLADRYAYFDIAADRTVENMGTPGNFGTLGRKVSLPAGPVIPYCTETETDLNTILAEIQPPVRKGEVQ